MKEPFLNLIHNLQNRICAALEDLDGEARFLEEEWTREGGGGGKTRVIANGSVFEKGGVNTSVVHGVLPEFIRERFGVEQGYFMAGGISLVIHPRSPLVPTVHANYRYFELYEQEGGPVVDAWFGGGADLTPYYLVEEDARHFHLQHKRACDAVHADLYPIFKEQCDRYFYNTHRGESRGIGGIFYDYLRPHDLRQNHSDDGGANAAASEAPGTSVAASEAPGAGVPALPALRYMELYRLAEQNGQAFLDAYIPIVTKHANRPYTEAQRYWQEIRRGRYVEFNLIHDRGTLFGLKTNGRVESILMSLPPRVRWDYNAKAEAGTEEAKLIEVLTSPRSWL